MCDPESRKCTLSVKLGFGHVAIPEASTAACTGLFICWASTRPEKTAYHLNLTKPRMSTARRLGRRFACALETR
eukprot:scaffold23154_cov67-Phaeocystis_antarctica.AAC.5